MKKFIIIFSLFAVLYLINSVNGQKSCHGREIDFCILYPNMRSSMIKLPLNNNELVKMNKTLHEVLDCFMNYAKFCTTPRIQETIKWSMKLGMHEFYEFLKPSNQLGHQDVFKYGVCINEHLREGMKCINDIERRVAFLMETHYKKRYALGCCEYRKIKNCLVDVFTRRCSQQHAEVLLQHIFRLITNLPNEICEGMGATTDEYCKEYEMPTDWKPKKQFESMISKAIKYAKIYNQGAIKELDEYKPLYN